MKRFHWKWITALLAVLLLAAGLTAASGEQAKKYTVMLYVCGADLERDNGQESASLGEILATRYNSGDINVVGLLGGTPRWAGNRFDPGVLSIVEVSGRRPTKVDQLPLSPMSDSGTLTSFLSYCKEHYPAEHYILVISDHGGGPLLGCCIDYLFDRSILSVNALSKGLADSPFANRGLDTIAFDCCLMGSLEISNKIAPYAKYMVATEDSMYGLGHDWLAGLENDETSLTTAERIAETTYQKNKRIIAANNACQLNSVSVVDLEKVTDVIPAMNQYFAKRPQVDKDNFTLISTQRRDAVEFGVTESGGFSQYDLVDVGSLVTKLGTETEEGSALLDAIQTAIPYHVADVENCLGLTVYHPYTNQKVAKNSMGIYANLNFASAYVDYVIDYTAIMTGTPLADFAGLKTGTDEVKDNRTQFTLLLNDEQAAHFGAAKMKIFWKNEDGGYSFTYVNHETGYDEGKITGMYNGVALFAVDAEGNPITKALPYQLAANGTVLIPADLTLPGEDGLEPVTHKALIYCQLDSKTKDLTPGGVAVWDDVMSCWTGSFNTVFSDYQQMAVERVSRIETTDENGILLPFEDWEESGKETWNLTIGEGWSFKMLDVKESEDQLYATFEVQDSQGNLYTSKLYKIIPDPGPNPVILVKYDDKDLILLQDYKISAQNQVMMMTGKVTNLTAEEGIIRLDHLMINGEAFDDTAEVYGAGDNWGLLENEEQMLNLSIPLDKLAGFEEITSITFDLVLEKAVTTGEDTDTLGVVPVEVTLMLKLTEAE